MYIEKIKNCNDIKQFHIDELPKIAGEIRTFLIDSISKTGGHLASNLGVVELTIALHYAFDLENDKIVWDVGHQAYTHKILSGRADRFDSLRQFGGISGFPKCEEDPSDAFNTGHSSTSISAALGFSVANELQGKNNYSIAVIGDGAMTGGMVYEAMNNCGKKAKKLIVILNDNGMSISKNVGVMSGMLQKWRSKNSYFKLKKDVKTALDSIPAIGTPVKSKITNLKKEIKRIIVESRIFEDFGFKYLGPLDGHNISEMLTVMDYAKTLDEPVLIHVHTEKGKGYVPAESAPPLYHSIGKFDVGTGKPLTIVKNTWSNYFGRYLCSIAEKNNRVVAISAAMPDGTGLSGFQRLYPKRFFDVGIAEQHAVTFAAALAKSGQVPVFAVYSTFLQRGYDQMLHDTALQNAHVVFAIDRSGPVGDDGETHQGVYDLSYLLHMPNMKVFSPSNELDLREMLSYAVNICNGPVAIRYPRGMITEFKDIDFLSYNRSPLKPNIAVDDGGDLDAAILSVGVCLNDSLKAARALQEKGKKIAVIDIKGVKPIDIKTIEGFIERAAMTATVENNVVIGGFGEYLEGMVNKKILKFAYPDEPIVQGNVEQLKKKYGLDSNSIYEKIELELLRLL